MASEKNMTEVYFEWWLEELKSHGLVKEYTREPKTFELYAALPIYYNQHYNKKEPIIKNFNLFQPITYTPDYKVVFDKRMLNKLFGTIDINSSEIDEWGFSKPGSIFQETLFYSTSDMKEGNFELWFDVKPPSSALRFSGSLGSSRDFPIKQRLVYEKFGIIINKVVPIGNKNSLFSKTFMPERYKWTDKSGQLRKMKDYEKSSKFLKDYCVTKDINIFF